MISRSCAMTILALAASLPANAAELRLWRLDCGSIPVADLSAFSDAFAYAGQSRTLTDSCYLIQHDETRMLWDLGLPLAMLGSPEAGNATRPTLARTLEDQLAEIGVTPDDIDLLGVSHYHFDHLGQAAAFAKAKLLISREDLAALRETPPPFGAEPDLLAPWLTGGAPVDEVSGDRDVFGDGSVVMLDLPGHTPGAYGLLLRLAETGPVLLSGDTVHFHEQIANGGVPPFNTDRAETLASMDRMKDIVAALDARLVIQHDPVDVDKLPAFPDSAR